MRANMNSTLAATLIDTAAGVGVWFFGLAKAIWPAHPQIAAFLVTVVAGIVVKETWPAEYARKRI